MYLRTHHNLKAREKKKKRTKKAASVIDKREILSKDWDPTHFKNGNLSNSVEISAPQLLTESNNENQDVEEPDSVEIISDQKDQKNGFNGFVILIKNNK